MSKLEPQNQALDLAQSLIVQSLRSLKFENIRLIATLVLMQYSVKPFSNQEDTTRKTKSLRCSSFRLFKLYIIKLESSLILRLKLQSPNSQSHKFAHLCKYMSAIQTMFVKA